MDIITQFNEIVKTLSPYSLKTVKITPSAKAPSHIWSSKFSGKPYWPKGKPYPKTHEGDDLFLLAQINFEEVPALAGFPETGLLQFFIAADDVYGMEFDLPIEEVINAPDGYRVVYHPTVDKDTSLLESTLPELGEDDYLPTAGEYSVSFSMDEEIPSATDYRFEQYVGDVFDLPEELGEYVYENLTSDGSKLGGYAYFTQEDPRGYQNKGQNWVLLFQMDTEYADGIDIMWGDAGVGNFFIEPDRLAKGDFSRVWYNWDCS